jgi:predicted MFS family arabinose efflux permease
MVAGPAFGGLIAALGGLRAPFVVVAITSGIALLASLWLPHRTPATRDAANGSDKAEPVEAPLAIGGIVALLLTNLAMLAGYGAFITTYAPLATERLGWTTVEVGIAFSFFGAGSIVLGPPLSHLADRTSRKAVAVAGAFPVAGFGLALVVGLPIWAVFGVAVLAGGGLTAFNASWYALLADVSGTRTRGRVFGIVSAVSNTGIVIGATTAAQLWERVDVTLAMASGSVAFLLALIPLLLFRAPARTMGA